MTARATGTFDIDAEDRPYDEAEGARLLRTSATKTFQGDLEGTSTVELLKAVAAERGSAGYVGLERFTGTLDGRPGGFVLQHKGVMARGEPALTVEVVPGTGTGELAGIRGEMEIEVEDGKHTYRFDYSLEG